MYANYTSIIRPIARYPTLSYCIEIAGFRYGLRFAWRHMLPFRCVVLVNQVGPSWVVDTRYFIWYKLNCLLHWLWVEPAVGYCKNGIRYIRSGIVPVWKLSTLRHRGKICIHICCVCFVQTALLLTYCSPRLVNKTELRKINLFQTNSLRRILRACPGFEMCDSYHHHHHHHHQRLNSSNTS